MSYDLTLDDVLEGGPTEVEQEVIDACTAGKPALRGTGRPKDGSDPSRVIRAALIRHLMRGGCKQAPVQPVGIRIVGAWIEDTLDFQGCSCDLPVIMHACGFATAPNFMDAHLASLNLAGSRVPGIDLHRARISRDLMLRGIETPQLRFECDGQVDMVSTHIGGTLECGLASFDGVGQQAIWADSLHVEGSVFLREGFTATGEVDLNTAHIGGVLDCSEASFDGAGQRAIRADSVHVDGSVFLCDGFAAMGEVNLSGAKIDGLLSCRGARFENPDGNALDLERATIRRDLFLAQRSDKTKAQIKGGLDLHGAEIRGDLTALGLFMMGVLRASNLDLHGTLSIEGGDGSIVMDLQDAQARVVEDDAAFWQRVTWHDLSGFTYTRLISDRGVAERLDWLAKKYERHYPGRPEKQFDPQPYTQLAAAYEAQGDRSAAQRVLRAREHRLALAQRDRIPPRDRDWGQLPRLDAWARYLFRRALGVGFGYGHAPFRAVWWSLTFVGLSAVFCYYVDKAGQMAPNSSVILTSEHWLNAVAAYCPAPAPANGLCEQPSPPMPLQRWRVSPSAQDYETFNAALYALDVFLPLDALGQERAWAPSPARGLWGQMGFVLRPLLQFAGWVITAVAAAAVTGVIGRKE